jgi:hypothetical protein
MVCPSMPQLLFRLFSFDDLTQGIATSRPIGWPTCPASSAGSWFGCCLGPSRETSCRVKFLDSGA